MRDARYIRNLKFIHDRDTEHLYRDNIFVCLHVMIQPQISIVYAHSWFQSEVASASLEVSILRCNSGSVLKPEPLGPSALGLHHRTSTGLSKFSSEFFQLGSSR